VARNKKVGLINLMIQILKVIVKILIFIEKDFLQRHPALQLDV
jgi:hypothetical protein